MSKLKTRLEKAPSPAQTRSFTVLRSEAGHLLLSNWTGRIVSTYDPVGVLRELLAFRLSWREALARPGQNKIGLRELAVC